MQGYCTINCDASVRFSKCGFGARIYTDDMVADLYGPIDCYPDSNVAELAGVVTSLEWVVENCDISKITTVVINCDNDRVWSIVNSGWMSVRESEESLRDKLYELRKKFNKVYAKTIKGHSHSARGRNLVNNKCDELAAKGVIAEKLVATISDNNRNSQIGEGTFRVLVKINLESYQFDVPAPNLVSAERAIVEKLKESFRLITYGKEKR